MQLTTKRLPNKQYQLLRDGEVVGEIWRIPKGGTPAGHFALSLHRVYWRRGRPNTLGGAAGISTRRLKDAVELARITLTELEEAQLRE